MNAIATKPWRQARKFKVGQSVTVKGSLKSACNKARIVEVIGDCSDDQAPAGKGYMIRFANGSTGSGWFDADFC
jgi:hypothetical protein